MTIRTALRLAQENLNLASDAPMLDAERLLLHVFGENESSWLYAHVDRELIDEQQQQFETLVAERATGKPLAYILGWQEFYGRQFVVTPDVLIPRPETEQLVEAALTYVHSFDISQRQKDEPYVIADIGTGSGCIAITLALESELRSMNQELRIVATDISEAALVVAQENAQRHGVLDRIEFLQGDMLAPLTGRQVDLIVSNPPYVPTADLSAVASAEVEALAKAGGAIETLGLNFEPRLALDGGVDGHYYIEQIKNAGVPAFVEGSQGTIVVFRVAHPVAL